MFPTQSKVNRSSSLWLLPVIALAMLLVGYAVFAASTAQAQTPSGEVCVEGIVIDWEEHPLAGWGITLTADIVGFTPLSTTSAADPDDLDDEYGYGNQGNNYGDQSNGSYKKKNFPFPEEDVLQEGEFEFTEDDIADGSGVGAVAGTYTATIESRPGWEGVTPTTITFPIEVGNDDCIHIRFKMRRIVVVNVFKIDADHQPLGDWIIRAIPGPGNLFASPQVTETSEPVTSTGFITGGQAVFTLTPGLWIFSEQEPKQDADEAPEHYVPIVPPTGRQELLIPDDLGPTETITVVFKNELVTGCFIVRKFGEIPATDAPTTQLGTEFNVAGWGFKLLRKDDSVARQGVTDARGEVRFDNLPLGPYTIVEEDRPGWDEVTPREVEFNVQGNNCDDTPGDTVVEFRNTQDDSGFCIEGRKVDANGGYGIPGWEITIEALDEGGALPVDDVDALSPLDVDSTTTDGLGEFRFDFLRNDYRVPGGLYEVCEAEQDGWLAHTPTCQVVRLPEWPGACVQLSDFVNQQVGHSESEHQYDKGNDYGKGDYGKGDSGYPSGQNSGSEGYPGGNNSQNPGGQYGEQGNAQCSTYHVVQAGEGLYEIGRAYQKTPQQMLDANPDVQDGDELWVYEGQRICIP